MQQAPEASDPQGWHKQFAAAANNRAWDLAVLTRNPAQNQEMLDAAHASTKYPRLDVGGEHLRVTSMPQQPQSKQQRP